MLEAGWEVVYLGRRLHDVPHTEDDPSLHHLVTTGDLAGLAEPGKAAYLIFAVNEDPTEWRVTHGIPKFLAGIETEWERPEGGAWIGVLAGPDLLAQLPPDSRYPCFEFWALVPPEGE